MPRGIPCLAGYQAVEAERYLPAPRGRPRSRTPSRLSVRAPSTFPSRRANWCAAAGVSASWRSWYRTGDRGGAEYTVRHGMTMGGAKRSAAELCRRDVPVVQHATRNVQRTTCRSMQPATCSGAPEVCQRDVPVVAEEYVLGLQIAVHDPALVKGLRPTVGNQPTHNVRPKEGAPHRGTHEVGTTDFDRGTTVVRQGVAPRARARVRRA